MDNNVDFGSFSPRVFKSHQRLQAINRGAKYIVTVRDPVKTIISWYRFLSGKRVPPILAHADVSAFVLNDDGTYIHHGMRFGATLWEYYLEYWKCRDLPNVLVLVFEDLVKDLAR